MARYKIAHDLDRTWVSKDEYGFYYWGDSYSSATLFPNYKAAKTALETLPVEKRMYGFPYKPLFMKFYDSGEHFKQEQEYLSNKRILRDMGY